MQHILCKLAPSVNLRHLIVQYKRRMTKKFLCDVCLPKKKRKCDAKSIICFGGLYQCLNEYSNIFEYFPPNIDIRIWFVVILNAKYYSNIPILCPNISEYWSLKIRGNAGIKEVLFSFFTWKDTYSTKSKSYDNLILVWL